MKEAKEKIKNEFLLVTIAEMFSESVYLLKHLLGWGENPYYYNLSFTGSKRPKKHELNKELIQLIEKNKVHFSIDFASFLLYEIQNQNVLIFGASTDEQGIFNILQEWKERK